MKLKTSLFVLIVLSQNIFSQTYFVRDNSVPVYDSNSLLQYSWAGGFQCAQFSVIDLNQDGSKDLVAFDRADNSITTFLNNGNSDYTWTDQYQNIFPHLESWMLLVDMNCDNLEDLLTYSSGHFALYLANISGGQIAFNYFGELSFENFAGVYPIYSNANDIPGIADVNGDGDMDILNATILGGYIEYFENQSIELTGNCTDSIFFESYSQCLGEVYFSGFNPQFQLGVSCSHGLVSPNDQNQREDQGYSLTPFDIDNDNDLDLFFGNLSFDNLILLTNGGDSISAEMVSQDTAFPLNNIPVSLTRFPAAYIIDVNNDNKKDLIATPSLPSMSKDRNNIWLYQNTGNDTAVFEFDSDSFLVGDMIDLGSNSKPVLFDFNVDGLQDLLIASSRYEPMGWAINKISAYQNTGTTTNPEFTLVNSDFADIDFYDLDEIKPCFGDLDGDSDEDMIVGDGDGLLHYFTNTAGAGNPAVFQLMEMNFDSIDVGQQAAPILIDLTNDGLLDLVVGERNGTLNFLENEGTSTNPTFIPVNMISSWGDVNVNEFGFPSGHANPLFYDFNDGNGVTLMVGSERGYLYQYDDFEGNINGTFTLLDSQFVDYDFGRYSSLSPAAGDLNSDGFADLLVGIDRGGMMYFKQTDVNSIQTIEAYDCNIYPNPANDLLTIESSSYITSIQMLDLLGRVVQTTNRIEQNQISVSLSGISSGVYLLKIETMDGEMLKKLVVEK